MSVTRLCRHVKLPRPGSAGQTSTLESVTPGGVPLTDRKESMADLALRSARLVIQSDRRLVREALAAYFSAGRGFTVVGHTGTGHGLRNLCALGRPDVALVDVTTLTAHTVRSLRELHAAFPEINLVVTYTSLTLEVLTEAVRAGVSSFVPSSHGLDAVRSLLRNRANHARPGTEPTPPAGQALTDRELGVISLMSSGHSVADIARLLHISPHTVDNYKRRVYAKLSADSQSLAVTRALELGLAPAREAEPEPSGVTGRSLLALVCGTPGPCMDRVRRTLVSNGLPFVHARACQQMQRDHWAQWHTGPLVSVLVDPTGTDWQMPERMGAAVVVVYSSPPDRATINETLAAGARAVLQDANVPRDLADVLSLVARGYLALTVEPEALGSWPAEWHPGHVRSPVLTSREQEVLTLMAAGHTIRQAARTLGIAAKTVENTQARLYRKLGTHSRAETLAVAYRLGLIDLSRRVARPREPRA